MSKDIRCSIGLKKHTWEVITLWENYDFSRCGLHITLKCTSCGKIHKDFIECDYENKESTYVIDKAREIIKREG